MKSITKAFTLIELLIVIVIIGILAVALIPRLTGAQARARDTARIADMRQMQAALELYAADNGGRYPGTSHYASINGLGCHFYSNPLWTGLFNSSFIANYLTALPNDPLSTNPSFCYGYSRLDISSLSCVSKDGDIVEFDGTDASGNLVGPKPGYVLTFKAENNLWDKYPRFGPAAANRYCIIGY